MEAVWFDPKGDDVKRSAFERSDEPADGAYDKAAG